MLDFIVKYWLQVLFGVIVTVLTGVCRYLYTQIKAERQRKQTDFQMSLREDIQGAIAVDHEKLAASIAVELKTLSDKDTKFEEQITSLNETMQLIKTGLLSVQGATFKAQCRELLKPEHEITLAEYEQLVQDHHAYNALGGNHDGDQLFGLVKLKYENSITG